VWVVLTQIVVAPAYSLASKKTPVLVLISPCAVRTDRHQALFEVRGFHLMHDVVLVPTT
jgi:hypothetical protein